METIQGVIHGKIIELAKAPGLPDGEAVAVTIQRVGVSESKTMHDPALTVESWCDRIVFDSTVSPTEKVVKGTRLLAEELVVEIEEGKTDENLLTDHPELTADDVIALRSYARTSVGLRRSFGGWAEDSEQLDKYLEWNRQQRKIDRREIED